MGFFNSLVWQKNDPKEDVSRFEKMIQMQKEQLFGISLYFRGIELMYSEQPEIIQMNLQSFVNIRERTEDSIAAAESLLLEVKRDPSKAKKLKGFKFPPTTGHPMLDQMTERVEIILRTYEQLFPGRSKSQSLNQEELMKLMMEASKQL
ncbi:MAG: hypothetical protein Q7J15_06925 [Candidatus Desulfaltia sp.]|nr:hypothetical protein [Candidatus Desulfaltia sp.]